MFGVVNAINPSPTIRTTISSSAEVATNNSAENDVDGLSSNNVSANDVPVSSSSNSFGNNTVESSATTSVNDCNVNLTEAATFNNNYSDQICRFYLKGVCRFGNLCRFSHDLSNVSDVNNIVNDGPSTSSSSLISKSRQISNWADAPVFVPRCIKLDYNTNSNPLITDVTLTNSKDCLNGGNTIPSDETVCLNGDNLETVDNCNLNNIPGAGTSDNVNATNCEVTAPAQTWASVVGGEMYRVGSNNVQPSTENAICPFEAPCPHGIYCIYPIHLELCNMCDQYCLHPTDQEQRRKHNKECLQQHEQAMELSFAIARSKDKTCGICFDIIMEKSGREKRFGILPNCNHIFCLECIRKWRQAKQFEHKITRSCPECRIASDFVCPSAFWVETKEEKDKLLNDYRAALGIKDCKYFKKGDGLCPFGNKCFYKHALPNGSLVDVGLPKRARKVRCSSNELSELLDVFLWEFVDQRNYRWLDDDNASDSDDSDFDEAGFISDH